MPARPVKCSILIPSGQKPWRGWSVHVLTPKDLPPTPLYPPPIVPPLLPPAAKEYGDKYKCPTPPFGPFNRKGVWLSVQKPYSSFWPIQLPRSMVPGRTFLAASTLLRRAWQYDSLAPNPPPPTPPALLHFFPPTKQHGNPATCLMQPPPSWPGWCAQVRPDHPNQHLSHRQSHGGYAQATVGRVHCSSGGPLTPAEIGPNESEGCYCQQQGKDLDASVELEPDGPYSAGLQAAASGAGVRAVGAAAAAAGAEKYQQQQKSISSSRSRISSSR